MKNDTLKIADFGLAKFLKAKETNSFIGTPAYMAPEIWKQTQITDLKNIFKSDVW